MDHCGDHPRVTSICLGHHLHGKCLMLLGALAPLLHCFRGVHKASVPIFGLCSYDLSGIKGLGDPFGRIMLSHNVRKIQTFGTVFSATVVPSRSHTLPIAAMKHTEILLSAVIPQRIAVDVRHGVSGGRIKISVHMLDHTIGMIVAKDLIKDLKQILHFRTQHMAMRLVSSIFPRLIDISQNDIAGMVSHKANHFLSLSHRLTPHCSPHNAKQGKITLRHQSQFITVPINLALHRTLGDSPEIHIAKLCQQDIVYQLIKVATHDIQLLKAHRIATAKTNRIAVQIEHSFGVRGKILSERAHSESANRRVTNNGICHNRDLQLIQPRGLRTPKSGIGNL